MGMIIAVSVSLVVGVVLGYAFKGYIARTNARAVGVAEHIIAKL